MLKKLILVGVIPLFVLACAVGCKVDQTREGKMPEIDVKEGQLPAYDIETADVEIGGKERTIEVPTIDVDVSTEERVITVPDINITMPDDKREPGE